MRTIKNPLLLISGFMILLFAGCTKDTPELSVNQHELNFSSTCVGNLCMKTVQVENTGSSELIINSISFEGTHRNEFSYTLPRKSLAVGEKGSITVNFSPLGIGKRSAQMVIHSNDKDNPNFRISVTGTGLPEPGSWKGDNIQFNVSEDGKGLTDAGSKLDEGASLIVSASGNACGGYITLRCYYYSDIPIDENSFNHSNTEDEIEGVFRENNTCEVSGSISHTSYFSSCSFTFNLGKLVAVPAASKSAGSEDTFEGRIEYYEDGRIKSKTVFKPE